MKRVSTTICLVAGFAVATVSAQYGGGQTQTPSTSKPTTTTQGTTPSGKAPSRTTQSSRSNANPTLTLIGCVEPGTSANTYMLRISEQPSSTSTAAATSGEKTTDYTHQTVQLMGSDVRAHSGQKVEVMGTFSPVPRSRTANGTPETRFTARSVRMLSAKCDSAGTIGTTGTEQPESNERPDQPKPSSQPKQY